MIFRGLRAVLRSTQGRRQIAYSSAIAVAVAICVAIVFPWERPRPAPDVTMMSIQGERISLTALRGRVVLVNFWATDCVICVREMPEMAALYRASAPRGLEAVFVAMPHDRPDRVLDFVRRNDLPFKVALDVQGEVLRAFGDVPGTPALFLIDKQGRIVRRFLGATDVERLQRLIDDRLADPA